MSRLPSWAKKAAIILFWFLFWQGLSMAVHNRIFLVGPVETLRALKDQLFLPEFWKAVFFSFGRIFLGFLAAFFTGLLTGSLAYRFPLLGEFLEPPVQFMKSIPVASFVILALIWTGAENLSVFISFLVVFPVLYISTVTGLQNTDPELLEMAAVFRVPLFRRIRHLYRGSLYPYLQSGCRSALGMGFKSGIAAEVIGVPSGSIGEGLYLSKIYLSTAELFAWTLVIILISNGFEKLFLILLKKLAGKGAMIHEND